MIAIVVLAALDILRAQALARIARWWDERTREPVLKASVLATLRRSTPATHGLQDVGTVRGFIVSSAPLPLFDAPWTPVFLVVLAVLNPLIGLLAAATAPLLLALAVANDVTTRRAMRGVSEAQMQLANFAHVAIRHADTIQAMGRKAPSAAVTASTMARSRRPISGRPTAPPSSRVSPSSCASACRSR